MQAVVQGVDRSLRVFACVKDKCAFPCTGKWEQTLCSATVVSITSVYHIRYRITGRRAGFSFRLLKQHLSSLTTSQQDLVTNSVVHNIIFVSRFRWLCRISFSVCFMHRVKITSCTVCFRMNVNLLDHVKMQCIAICRGTTICLLSCVKKTFNFPKSFL